MNKYTSDVLKQKCEDNGGTFTDFGDMWYCYKMCGPERQDMCEIWCTAKGCEGMTPGKRPDPNSPEYSINEVLENLEKFDETQAKVVEMRFFGGMSNSEIAEALGTSERTVVREWIAARLWLAREMKC